MTEITITAASGAEELQKCAALMAGTDPWITLGRKYEQCLNLLNDTGCETYVARVSKEFGGLIVVNMQGSNPGANPLRAMLAKFGG